MSNFNTLFEPNYLILTFLMIKTFFFIEFVGLLALIRCFVASQGSRLAALFSVAFALVGIAAKYIPPLAGPTGGEAARVASWIVNQGVFAQGSGMALPIIVSALFALSWHLKGRRWWGLDLLHLIAALVFFGLWINTQL